MFVIFHRISHKPLWADLYQMWYKGSPRLHNQLLQFWDGIDRLRGVDSVGGSKFAIACWQAQSLSTQADTAGAQPVMVRVTTS